MSKMIVLSYQMRFLTPAFLGDAEQDARWRTPPIKALLRQFWRMAYAADHAFKVDMKQMRHEERLLFGHAWLDDDIDSRGKKIAARRSLVRIRLQNPSDAGIPAWSLGSQTGVSPLPDGLSTSYAWFGLIKRGGGLRDRKAIKAAHLGESVRTVQISAPETHADSIRHAMAWIGMFGTLGARSRGSWGSLELGSRETVHLDRNALLRGSQALEDCLSRDWPASLAVDGKGLCCWESRKSWNTWDSAMREVAALRKEVRTSLKAVGSQDLRPTLGFAGAGRMPSPLRWKIVQREHELGIRIAAMPHTIPEGSGSSLSASNLLRAWTTVISTLDGNPAIHRI